LANCKTTWVFQPSHWRGLLYDAIHGWMEKASRSRCPLLYVKAPTYKGTIISLEPCALNAHFQYFILRYNKISLLYGYPWKKGLRWKEAQSQGDFTNNFNIYTCMPQNNYTEIWMCNWIYMPYIWLLTLVWTLNPIVLLMKNASIHLSYKLP